MDPWSGDQYPTYHLVWPKIKGKKERKKKKKTFSGSSLVVQWLRTHLPMQGTQVLSLVGELTSPHTAG